MGNCEVLLKSSYWTSSECNYYGETSNAAEIFKNIPKPQSRGMFRISYLNSHLASEFPGRFSDIVSPNSNWLITDPYIDVKFEWDGQWGDTWPADGVHGDNLRYLNDRVFNEGLRISSFVQNDISSNCYRDTESNVLAG